jgi:ferredoxin-NADP reductase
VTDRSPANGARLPWRVAKVTDVVRETPRVKSLILSVPGWPGHRPGQHVEVRLTGEDGSGAQRSYSIASAPEAPRLVLTVERIEDGEVSPYLVDEVRPEDRFEIRGPIGGYFVWTVDEGGPLFLIAGGSGLVPLMAMLRHRAAVGSRVRTALLYSSRAKDDVIYRDELDLLAAKDDGLRVLHTLTRRQPEGWVGLARRIDDRMLTEAGFPPDERPRIFICGPTGLVELAAQLLSGLGHARDLIKTERFGPT